MVDLTIRGAGILGLMTAWRAIARGATVQVIDPLGPGGGASGGVVGALAPHTPDGWNPKKQMQLESLLQHRTLWPEIEETSGLSSGYAPTGRLQPLLDDRAVELAKGRAEAAIETWGAAATWSVTDTPGAFAPPSTTGLWVKDTLSAHIHPRRACQSLAKAIERRGGQITKEGADAGINILATGTAGLSDLNAAFGKTVGVAVKGQAALLDFDASGQPQVFADGLHIIPHLDGTTAVGSTTEREFDAPDQTDQLLDEVLQRAAVLLPALADASVLERWAGLRPRAKSRAPVIGAWPDRPGTFVANGGFKIGFGMAPVIADLILDLALDGVDRIPETFRLDANL